MGSKRAKVAERVGEWRYGVEKPPAGRREASWDEARWLSWAKKPKWGADGAQIAMEGDTSTLTGTPLS